MKIGDYVRTKNGIIGKIESKNLIGYNDWIIDTLYYNDDEIIDDWTCGIKEYDIVKSSQNIIDLIEVGDIVVIINGLNKEELILIKDLKREKPILESHKIKSILTKEQFESMKYKVGD